MTHVAQLLAEKSLPHPREPLRIVRHEELDLPRGHPPADLRLREQDVDDPGGLLGGVDQEGAPPRNSRIGPFSTG